MSDRDTPAWIPGPRFEDAVLYAIRTHALQARKGGTIPYLAHLLAVASLVMEDGGSEEETIAALLHDAAEDQGGKPRLRDIETRFGSTVAAIVLGCSDTLEMPKPTVGGTQARVHRAPVLSGSRSHSSVACRQAG